jgi:hypothetical protein
MGENLPRTAGPIHHLSTRAESGREDASRARPGWPGRGEPDHAIVNLAWPATPALPVVMRGEATVTGLKGAALSEATSPWGVVRSEAVPPGGRTREPDAAQ